MQDINQGHVKCCNELNGLTTEVVFMSFIPVLSKMYSVVQVIVKWTNQYKHVSDQTQHLQYICSGRVSINHTACWCSETHQSGCLSFVKFESCIWLKWRMVEMCLVLACLWCKECLNTAKSEMKHDSVAYFIENAIFPRINTECGLFR